MSVDLRPAAATLDPQLPARLLGERGGKVISFDFAADGRLLVALDSVAAGSESLTLIQNWTELLERRQSGRSRN
jgi:hypothetical protein